MMIGWITLNDYNAFYYSFSIINKLTVIICLTINRFVRLSNQH